MSNTKQKLILWFDELTIRDVGLVGGKNASLGEMYRKLTPKGISIPNGFAVTAEAYRYFLSESGLDTKITEILSNVNRHNIKTLATYGSQIRNLILKSTMPEVLCNEIATAYRRLSREYGVDNVDVAVRSSATAEDLPSASFAGQQESYLNISGADNIIKTVKMCISSLFTNRAIAYRIDKGFDHMSTYLSVGVQKMVRSDKASSGVMFTLDTESGFRDVILINGAWGLGENVVKGRVTPDEYYVFKTTLKKDYKPIIGKQIGSKEKRLIYARGKGATTVNINVPIKDRERFVLNNEEILTLAKWGMEIEEHYGRPMDIEWAKDGNTKKLYIVQARPETVRSIEDKNIYEQYYIKSKGKLLLEGSSVGKKIGEGKVRVIKDVRQINQFKAGEVLVTRVTDPDWEPIMRIAAAIVTEKGGKTSHAAIVSRELGIPCVVGAEDATTTLHDGQYITVSSAEGEIGKIYDGKLPYDIKRSDLSKLQRPKTKIMMNVGVPREAFSHANVPNDGVGLAREEFIIANFIKIHPLALINFDKVNDKKAKAEIASMTAAYKSKIDYYVDNLAEGIGRIAAAYYPKDVIVRLSDFKTNEYRTLLGGEQFEPVEANPMIGWRGASRYYDPKYKAAFVLECKAFKKVRDEYGLTNVKAMVPFCRTVEEGKKVLQVMADNGLKRGVNGFEVYVMCEIPSNVILGEEFAEIFDGFSIGTNDLTQLTMGIDRDSELVAPLFDERNEAIRKMVRQIITIAKAKKRKIGVCGDAPSTFPEFAQFLVECGIDSMSLSPDAVFPTMLAVLAMEKKMRFHKVKKILNKRIIK